MEKNRNKWRDSKTKECKKFRKKTLNSVKSGLNATRKDRK